jgi:iron complex outermembrane receptor protein
MMKTGIAPGRYLLPLVICAAGLPGGARAQESTPAISEITVVGDRTNGYHAKETQVGPLARKALLDTPYSVDVLPHTLIDDQQLKSVREAFRYLPSVQGENIRPQTRGMQAGVVQNTRIDGMNIAATTDYPAEQFDRIEVLNGLAGAFYGPTSPAGTFNYVLKRPTAEPSRRISVGYSSQSSKLVSFDVGDTVGANDRLGYRINLLSDRGEGYVDRSRLERTLGSVALDIGLAEHTRLELNGSRYHYLGDGFPGTFALANNVVFPAAPDPKRVGYGQPFGGDDNVTETLSSVFEHEFDSNWHISAGVLRQTSDRASTVPTNTLLDDAGTYRTTAATTTYSLDEILSNTLVLNGRIRTGTITHDLVVSNTGFDWDRYIPYNRGAILLGTASLDDPVVFDEPVFPDFKSRYKGLNTSQQSITVGDTLGFGDRWSAGLYTSQSWIKVRNYDSTGAVTSRYDDDGISSNATLAYKPMPNMTVYASYADSLQQGDIAPTGSANAGAGLAPYRSRQWEVGYKVGLSRLVLAADAFRIMRPYAFTGSDNVFRTQGKQVNNGLELSASGAVTQALSIFSAITYLDPKVKDTGIVGSDDKQVLGLSKVVASASSTIAFRA